MINISLKTKSIKNIPIKNKYDNKHPSQKINIMINVPIVVKSRVKSAKKLWQEFVGTIEIRFCCECPDGFVKQFSHL